MKISTASKKVLASALSAAMVVAFAPTVAFGSVAAGDTVYVQFDTTGVTVKDGNSALNADAYEVAIESSNTVKVPSLAGHAYQFSATSDVASWYVDLNENGKFDSGVDLSVTADAATGSLDFSSNASKITLGSTIVLKPAAAAAAITATAPTTIKQTYGSGDKLAFSVTSKDAKDANALRYSLAKDGKEVAYALSDALTADAAADVEFTFIGDDASKAAGQLKVGEWGKGAWTLSVKDVASDKVVASSEMDVVEVALQGVFGKTLADTNAVEQGKTKNGQTFLAVKGEALAGQLKEARKYIDVTAIKVVNGAAVKAVEYTYDGKTAVTYNASDGFADANATKPVKVAEGMTLAPAYDDAAQIGSFGFTAAAAGSNDKITAAVKYPVAGADYTFTLSGAATATKTIKHSASSDKKATTDEQTLVDYGTSKAPAGTYTLTVTEIKDAGTNQEKSTVIGTKDITLTEVTLDAGAKGTIGTDKKQTVSAVYDSDTKLADIISATPDVKDAAADRFVGWSLDGTKIVNGTEKVGTSAVTLTAVYKSDKQAAAPTYSYENGLLTLTNNAGDGYELRYLVGNDVTSNTGTVYSGPISLDSTKSGNQKVTFAAYKKAGNTATGASASAVVTITGNKDKATVIENWAKAAVAGTTAASTAAKPQYYSEVLTDTVVNAKAAISAVAYGTAADWNALVLAQKTAVLQAIADYENGQIDALVAGVTAADGSVKKLAASTAAEKKADIAKVIEDFGYNNDYEADGTTPNAATKSAVAYTNPADAGSYVTAIAGASKAAASAATKIAKADVDAAKAVSDKVAKLAADYAEVTRDNYQAATDAVIDAQTDYAALSADAKSLVSADTQETIAKVLSDATVIANQVKDEEAAQKLADAQDLAAARQLYSKTVTAKAKVGKKAQGKSFTYKLAASESGATATYSKASGSKYIKVSASGKVTFSKVKAAKKAKTYKAKVTVTYGTQTATKTVTYKVVKK